MAPNASSIDAFRDELANHLYHYGFGIIQQSFVDALLNRDEYRLLAEFHSYLECQSRVEQVYCDQERWTRMSVPNTARCGFFSSDRMIEEYAEAIRRLKPVRVS